VPEHPRLVLRENNDLTSPFGEPLEHPLSVRGGSPAVTKSGSRGVLML
jgi:hypothetical protein